MFQTFSKRLKCNTDCERLVKGSAEREQCRKENCIEIEVPKTAKELEEEYDYAYGYEDDSAVPSSDPLYFGKVSTSYTRVTV